MFARKIKKCENYFISDLHICQFCNNKCTLFNAGHLPPYKISAGSNELFKIRIKILIVIYT